MPLEKLTDARDNQYTYPTCVAFFKSLAESNLQSQRKSDFGYFELDNATLTTIREMVRFGELRIEKRHNDARFVIISDKNAP